MSNDEETKVPDPQKIKKLIRESYQLSKNYKTLNDGAVDKIIELMKRELMDDED